MKKGNLMKKYISFILALLLLFSLPACSKKPENTPQENTGKPSIICTIFPEYDWVREILGDKKDNFNLELLLDNGVDLHNYQATADDIIAIKSSDLFIYVGGESDKWVSDLLAASSGSDGPKNIISLMDVLKDDLEEEEAVEGMEAEEEEEEEEAYDEHVWLSLKNAQTVCGKITEVLCSADSENADVYKANLKAYNDKLEDLDDRYEQVVENGKKDAILFGDRFPFRYMTEDYDIDYYAAFMGCSAETEAKFETITFLADKVDELKLKTVLTIEGSNSSIAQTIVENTESKDAEILTMNSMQSTTKADVDNGATYLKIMENNLSVLEKALA